MPDGEPVILLAHEPDIMPRVPDRVSLVMSGHTHGGQVRLFGWSPVVPSRYGNRYAYGHVREQCDLIVSGGLGCSIMPVRFGVPPEIVLVSITGERGGVGNAASWHAFVVEHQNRYIEQLFVIAGPPTGAKRRSMTGSVRDRQSIFFAEICAGRATHDGRRP